MECPQGMWDATKDDVLLLTACIYGLVQAARQYYKKVVKIKKEIGFTGGNVDPCLFCKRSDKGICFIALYVDDNLLVGHPPAIDDAIRQMREHDLILKIEDTLHDYLSCEIKFSSDRSKAWLGQPHLISNLENTFGTGSQALEATLLQVHQVCIKFVKRIPRWKYQRRITRDIDQVSVCYCTWSNTQDQI